MKMKKNLIAKISKKTSPKSNPLQIMSNPNDQILTASKALTSDLEETNLTSASVQKRQKAKHKPTSTTTRLNTSSPMTKKSIGKKIGKEFSTTSMNNQIILGIDPGLKFLGIGLIEIDENEKLEPKTPEPLIKEENSTIIKKRKKKKKKEPQNIIPYLKLIKNYAHLYLQITTNRTTEEKLYFIYKEIDQLIITHKPELIVVEDSFIGINKRSAIQIGLTRGSILTAAGKHNVPVIIIPPKQIKMELTFSGTATKEEVEEFLSQNLKNWEKSEKLDSSDALAAAICGIKHLIKNERV